MTTEQKQPYGLGRVFRPDPRDKNFPLKAALPQKATARTSRYWNQSAWLGDQGETSQCVAFAFLHWLHDGPTTHNTPVKPLMPPNELYTECQRNDEWYGEEPLYEGTSVRAGAKVLMAKGYISEYRWTWNVEEMAQAVLNIGPVVVGTNWFSDMFFPDKKGIIKPTGFPVGGHAYLCNGCSLKTRMLRFKNSWGKEYGKNGNMYMSFDDFQELINQHGEVVLAVEAKK